MSYHQIKAILHNSDTTITFIEKKYMEWVDYNQYLVFEQTKFKSPTRHFASLVPKRGNEKYAYNIKRRFKEFSLPFDYEKKISTESKEEQTNILFITLTNAVTEKSNFKTEWEAVSYHWNKFLANLRKQFGRVLSVRCYESSDQGFPHIHAIIYFQDQTFTTFFRWSKKKNRYLWRIPFPTVEKIRRYWHSFIDIQGMVDLSDGFKYLGKYLSKSSDLSQKATKTLSLTWAFHKRAFSLGKKFKMEIFKRYLAHDLTHLSPSQTFSGQMTLYSTELKNTLPSFLRGGYEKVKIVGILGKNNLKKLGGIPKYEWNFGLTDKQAEYSLYCTHGKQKNPQFKPMSPLDFIKNAWKFLADVSTPKISKQKIYEKLKKIQETSKEVTKNDMRYMQQLLKV